MTHPFSEPVGGNSMIEVTEVSIAQLRAALEAGQTTAVELVQAYLARIDAYDGPNTATALNAVVVRNPEAMAEARASDARRAKGETLGPLDGIPYTAKDSYLVKGLTAASGSPAFADLVAHRDAFTIERLRAAGAICLGKTNMPPMANGGMQRGVYGRAESPYNAAYLTAPFASGSSNGAGTATAASFSAFGLAEETWSSGRGPASNNGLCAYTPSRGVISVRGNWPLTPTMDVVVPYARTMADLLEVLDVVVAEDPDTRGDLWRLQPWVPIPSVDSVRPASYAELAVKSDALAGKRLGVPKMYINADPEAGTSEAPGIGGPREHPEGERNGPESGARGRGCQHDPVLPLRRSAKGQRGHAADRQPVGPDSCTGDRILGIDLDRHDPVHDPAGPVLSAGLRGRYRSREGDG